MFIVLLQRTTRYVILSGVRSTESRNLRTETNICSQIGAKILRLALLAQDDRLVRLCDKLKFEHPYGRQLCRPLYILCHFTKLKQ